jgi:hypothetical protein
MEHLTNAEVKLIIAKLIDVAYSKDKGVTTKIVMDKGLFKMTMDADGNVALSGKGGYLRFSGKPALEQIGVAMKRLTVNFVAGQNGNVHFIAGINLKITTFTVSGDFNIVDLITACSGLLCQAARLVKVRNSAAELELKRVMGY